MLSDNKTDFGNLHTLGKRKEKKNRSNFKIITMPSAIKLPVKYTGDSLQKQLRQKKIPSQGILKSGKNNSIIIIEVRERDN